MALSDKDRMRVVASNSEPEIVEKKTVDGQTVTVVGRREIRRLSGKAICAGGTGHGCRRSPPHRFVAAGAHDDYSRGLRGVKLDKQQSRDSYFCRQCQKFMGCYFCVGDVASLVCNNCQDWASDISEFAHGRMVKDSQLKDHGMKLVLMVGEGQLSLEDFNKLWNEARIGNYALPERKIRERKSATETMTKLAEQMKILQGKVPKGRATLTIFGKK